MTADEEQRLFDALPTDLRPLVEFALLSGQRKNEIVTLRWSDVDLPGQRATVSAKGGGRHTFPLSPRMVAIVKDQPKACAQVFTYVCERTAPKKGEQAPRVKGQRYPFSAQGWQRKWRKALETAGVADYRFHDNRHTAATRNLRATGNLKAVSKLLGHTNIATTSRYAHALEDDVRRMLFDTESRNTTEQEESHSAENRRKPGSAA